jgi:hypothetical protein
MLGGVWAWRLLPGLTTVLLLAGCAGSGTLRSGNASSIDTLPAGAVVLRVRVTDVEFTDWYPACEEGEELCVPVVFWYRYSGNVREVVRGEYADSTVQFARLQHAEFIDRVTRDCHVVLEPASKDLRSKVGIEWTALKLLSPLLGHDDEIRALRKGY